MVLLYYLVIFKRKTFVQIISGKLSTYLGIPHYFLKNNEQKILGFKLTKEGFWEPIQFLEMPTKKTKEKCIQHMFNCIAKNTFVKFSTMIMN